MKGENSVKHGVKRVIVIVLDGVGVGAAHDADLYGDQGSDTLGNISQIIADFTLPNMNLLGLGKLNDKYRKANKNNELTENLVGGFGKMQEESPGKDTTTGHWELMGIILKEPFPVYPDGFPKEIMDEFVSRTGHGYLGNTAASGTEIIKDLGGKHLQSGELIVYTSADSVFQIAAHEKIISLDTLYKYCKIAREILDDEHAVSRVIARPFAGEPGSFYRTNSRKDFSLDPPEETLLDRAKELGHEVIGIGKVSDIFNGRGFTASISTKSNEKGIEKTIEVLREGRQGIVFVNLIDFDMLFGHRNDPFGYAESLIEFDSQLPNIISAMSSNDLLMITADHGCDPTNENTDHTRELVPLLVYGEMIKPGVDIGKRDSFSDVAATIDKLLSLNKFGRGKDFSTKIMK